jgi:chromosomal replication initiation ATPase DnaA
MLDTNRSFATYEILPEDEGLISELRLNMRISRGTHRHIWGPAGTGKTHLTHALISVAADAGNRVFLQTAEYLNQILIKGRDPTSEAKQTGPVRVIWAVDDLDRLDRDARERVCGFLRQRLTWKEDVITTATTSEAPELGPAPLLVELRALHSHEMSEWIQRKLDSAELKVTETGLAHLASFARGTRRRGIGIISSLRNYWPPGSRLSDLSIEAHLQTITHHAN